MAGFLFREPVNAMPVAWFTGTKDNSQGSAVATEEARPVHFPFVQIYAEKGPIEPQVVTGSDVTKLYGSKFMDVRSAYATPVIPFITRGNAHANMMMFQRLVPGSLRLKSDGSTMDLDEAVDLATARVCLGLLVNEVSDIPVYERDENGNQVKAGAENPKGYKTSGTTAGIRAQWVYRFVEDLGFGEATKTPEAEGTFYPILEFKATWFGGYGNNLGVALIAPVTAGTTPINEAVVKDQMAYTYRIQFAERENEFAAPTTIKTLDGDRYCEVTFKEGTFNKYLSGADNYIGTTLLDAYRNLSPKAGRQPTYGPFNDVKIHTEYVEELSRKIYEAEIKVNTKLQEFCKDVQTQEPKSADAAMYVINLVSGCHTDGSLYYTFEVADDITPFDGTTAKVSNKTETYVYARGGKDGDMSFQQYDEDVRREFKNLGTSSASFEIEDMAQYPATDIYDVGFSMETKREIMGILSLRPDVNLVLSPHDLVTKVSDSVKREQRKIKSVLGALTVVNQAVQSYPESVIHGTSLMRAVCPVQVGKMQDGSYPYEVPATIEVFEMRAEYMGSGDGIYRSGRHYDESPYNHMKVLKDVDHLFIPGDIREDVWEQGGVFFQNKRRNVPFCAGLQTMYMDDTSVLNSDINMKTVCELNRICFEVWTELTGTSRYTKEQFIERSNNLIANKVRDRFDGRFIIEPNTFFSGGDEKRGYSWSCEIDVYMPNMRTVAKNTVITHRIDSYGGN